jgi:2,4-dienoyl-CoA reductase-like NADH-dependent reductase (Old Yellow Enzyme family)
MGRIVHPSFLDGEPGVSASATQAPGEAHTYAGKQPHATARALRLDEIPGILDDYRHAARNAMEAGFDGVQIHAANGYLIDQFLRDGANFRTDAYGGPVENRIRLLGEVARAVAGTVGAERTGVRLSPNGVSNGVNDSHPEALFPVAAALLAEIGIAFLELREPGPDGTRGKPDRPPIAPAIRKAFAGPLVLNSDYDFARAQAVLDAGVADAIAFGRTFLANPDLPHRFAQGIPLQKDVMETWYTQGPAGYTDYPTVA